MRLSVVIPAYNEADRLPKTLAAAESYLSGQSYPSEVVVVDDGSSDETVLRVREFADASQLRVRVIAMPHRGKGGAVKTGMLAAVGEWRLLCDADLAMPFEEIDRFFERVDAGEHVIIGSRQIAGARRENEPGYRHLMGRVFNFVTRALVVAGIADTQCGYKMFAAAAAREVFERLTIDGFAFDVEALFIARHLGYRIDELPILWRHHPDSRVSAIRHSLEMFWQVLGIRWRAMRGGYRG